MSSALAAGWTPASHHPLLPSREPPPPLLPSGKDVVPAAAGSGRVTVAAARSARGTAAATGSGQEERCRAACCRPLRSHRPLLPPAARRPLPSTGPAAGLPPSVAPACHCPLHREPLPPSAAGRRAATVAHRRPGVAPGGGQLHRRWAIVCSRDEWIFVSLDLSLDSPFFVRMTKSLSVAFCWFCYRVARVCPIETSGNGFGAGSFLVGPSRSLAIFHLDRTEMNPILKEQNVWTATATHFDLDSHIKPKRIGSQNNFKNEINKHECMINRWKMSRLGGVELQLNLRMLQSGNRKVNYAV
uniref:Uncharacterized protein n=1 Tax=Oryza punctata TaxID=4537 RepID=A0A0E0JJX7_ORYPU